MRKIEKKNTKKFVVQRRVLVKVFFVTLVNSYMIY